MWALFPVVDRFHWPCSHEELPRWSQRTSFLVKIWIALTLNGWYYGLLLLQLLKALKYLVWLNELESSPREKQIIQQKMQIKWERNCDKLLVIKKSVKRFVKKCTRPDIILYLAFESQVEGLVIKVVFSWPHHLPLNPVGLFPFVCSWLSTIRYGGDKSALLLPWWSWTSCSFVPWLLASDLSSPLEPGCAITITQTPQMYAHTYSLTSMTQRVSTRAISARWIPEVICFLCR